MLTIIIIFAIGFLGAMIMLFLQMRKIRSGAIDLAHTISQKPKMQINVGHVRRTIWQILRSLVHIAIMNVIRFWAFISHFIQKKWQQKFAKKEKLGADGLPEPKKESFFLHSVGEYKTKLKKIKDKLKEKDQTPVA